MAANSGTSKEAAAHGETTRPILKRRLTLEREDAERERISDLAIEVCQWLSQTLGVDVTRDNYINILDTGVELCRLQNILVTRAGGNETKIRYNANAKKSSMQARGNITLFTEWCKGFIEKEQVFESNDLLDHKNELKCQARVLLCLDKVKQRYPLPSEGSNPDPGPSHNDKSEIESDTSNIYSYFYPIAFLCLATLVLLGGACYFFVE